MGRHEWKFTWYPYIKTDTGRMNGEQCIHCKKWKDGEKFLKSATNGQNLHKFEFEDEKFKPNPKELDKELIEKPRN